MPKLVVAQRFCGPPTSGNGGYVCGLLARDIAGLATGILRARIPLDAELSVSTAEGAVVLTDGEGLLIGKAEAAQGIELPTPPDPPSLEEATRAEANCLVHTQRVHPICFCCGPERGDGDGLRVFAGQIEDAPAGHVACPWTPHANFADADGLTPTEIVWAALDCPGVFAWLAKEGRHGALLGTMTCEVIRRPKAGEPCIVTAWPVVREGRKETAGVALFSAQGELLARGLQVWVILTPTAQSQGMAPRAA